MTLAEWRLDEGLTYARLATLISSEDHAVSAETARRFCLPEDAPLRRMPDVPTLRNIFAATGGKVAPNDFAGVEG